MKAVYKEPGKAARIVEIENSLQALQEAVGGYIETVTAFSDAAILCNEEGGLQGMPYNCTVIGVDFVGPVLAVGVDGCEMCGLSDEAADFLQRMLEGKA